jgi:predicted  nucleic acid-binding Zn-ribbon protein
MKTLMQRRDAIPFNLKFATKNYLAYTDRIMTLQDKIAELLKLVNRNIFAIDARRTQIFQNEQRTTSDIERDLVREFVGSRQNGNATNDTSKPVHRLPSEYDGA